MELGADEGSDDLNEKEEAVKKTITLDEIMDDKSEDSQSATQSRKEGEDEDDEESNNRYYEIFVNEIRKKEQLEQIEKDTN